MSNLHESFATETMLATATGYIVTAEKAGWKAIVGVAVYLKAASDRKAAVTLAKAAMIGKGLSDGSAANYVSKSGAVADHWVDGLMPANGETFADYVERAVIEVQAHWHDCGIAKINKRGPVAPNAGDASDAPGEAGKVGGNATGEDGTGGTVATDDDAPELVPATPAMMVAWFEQNVHLFASEQLDLMSRLIVAERDKRAAMAEANATGTNG